MKKQVKFKLAHPYIEKRRGYRGGRAIIAGTNFPVSSVANYILKQGMLPEQLVRMFPRLTLAQIYDALSYYYDHQAEMEAEMERSRSEDALAATLPTNEILRFQYDVAAGEFVVSRLGKLVPSPAADGPDQALS
jgi:uncharacterized protein (DUF433 family)